MLNITENTINNFVNMDEFKAFRLLRKTRIKRLPLILITLFLMAIFLCLFLPWTQNVNAKGYVTTILPEQRPQAIQAIIPGRLEKWYVREGDFVEQGDTIVFLSEIKSEYFDPNLIARTAEQVEAKSQSIESYAQKVTALENQYVALEKSLELKREQIKNKIQQARNKIAIDSTDLVAFEINLKVAENQLSRTKELYDKGLKTLTELQEKELKKQEASAKVTVQQNKLLNQRNELLNLRIELPATEREYADKLAKSQSEQQSAVSAKLESIAATSKLQNQLSNYSERQKFYYITAPQSGYVTKAIKKGIGETIKEGADVATIMPARYDLAIEIYLKPQDLPLMKIDNPVQLRFDGWPAIVISGWPASSTGVFTGRIAIIDRFISDNGYYRMLISPDPTERAWPDLRVGAGARAFILLNDVPIWYEIWRQLNGFPPDFYSKEQREATELKRKAPLRSVK
ncbi:MAG TPA: HlyD family efflux transporter periplasmic adaptor subunit [Saprospiraceae bacterium]|nr:HlyD family efflux transporter periplasmic adaptor subunit [Saprospiraceae bacterium]HMQ83712.1 HlyD family efflux transporter periplasmic adaptor subunit [Saprospiraceae bacterium]